jgi:Raf kinase inhibitor-like YbhB/YbcL family protein
MDVRSPAFENGGIIPARFTADGPGVSPALDFTDVPARARSLALLVTDPDAPLRAWVHWLLYDLPATARRLPEGVLRAETLPDGSRQGRNDFGRIGWGGPAPPAGEDHRYVFRLVALDAPTGLRAGATREQVEAAMRGHVVAEATLTGRYVRPAHSPS